MLPDFPNFTLVDENIAGAEKSCRQWVEEYSAVLKGFTNTQTVRVAVLAEKNAGTISFLYTAYQLGWAYVPVDVKAPDARIEGILTQLEPTFFFVQKNIFPSDKQFCPEAEVVWESAHFFIAKNNCAGILVNPPHLAFILFTSGSTGIPKGVMSSKQNVLCFVNWMIQKFSIDQNATILSVAPLHFDLSVFDVFAAAKTGARLVIPTQQHLVNPMHLAQTIAAHGVNTIYATPTWYSLLVQYGKLKRFNFSHVKTLLVAGEALKVELVNTLRIYFPNAQISNLYGPTETNVCTHYTIPQNDCAQSNGVVAIGTACPYAVVRTSQHDVLEVSGESVMLGYWPNLYHNTWYTTGDVVRFDSERNVYYYVNRIDRMVKRNGYRIEPAEIEIALLKHTHIAQVAVTAVELNGNVEICAHYSAKNNTAIADLHQFCLNHLPQYMVPDKFHLHSQLPITSSGKTDYNALTTV